MPHSAEDIYLLVMTGGYRAADIKRWADEIAAEAVKDSHDGIYEIGFEEGHIKGFKGFEDADMVASDIEIYYDSCLRQQSLNSG